LELIVPDDDDGVAEQVLSVPLVWIGPEEVPIQFANQFLVQVNEEEVIITVGQVSPPIVLGTAEQQMEAMQAVEVVPVRVASRIAMTGNTFRKLLRAMTAVNERYDEVARAARETEEGRDGSS
jgi:hypothetical protein